MQRPQTRSTSPFPLLTLTSLLPTLLLLFFLSSTPLHPGSSPLCRAMDVQKLCQARCYYGKGGNLCNCNAFHFAGKRSSSSSSSSGGGSNSGQILLDGGDEAFQLSRPFLELALADMRNEEEMKEKEEEKKQDENESRVPRPAAAAVPTDGVLRGIPLASPTDDNALGEDRKRRGEGRRRGGERGAGGVGLFDVSRTAEEEEEEQAKAEEEEGRQRALHRLSSLIKTAMDERLIDRYEGSRKRKQSALPFEEAEFVY